MNIFDFIYLLGGLAFFLFGMRTMSGGLERLTGGRLERTLKKMTDRTPKGLLLGILMTIALQSSSATVIMTVGLVNSGVMQLEQSIAVMLGSNIGTTFTAWMLSLIGIEGSSAITGAFSDGSFFLVFALVGIIVLMLPEKKKSHDVAGVLLGFSLLTFGMSQMSGSVTGLAQESWFLRALTMFENPALGTLASSLLAALMQSSAAVVGILQALSLTGSVTYAVAIPLVAGANIGTCVTVLVSSIGASKDAKRVAASHIGFNIFGAIIFMIPLYIMRAQPSDYLDNTAGMLSIAIIHTIFNIVTVSLALPLRKPIMKLIKLLIKDKKLSSEGVILDERLLKTPAVAVSECARAQSAMMAYAKEAVTASIKLIYHFDRAEMLKTEHLERLTDQYEDSLGSFLVKLSERDLTESSSLRVTMMLHSLNDIERIADHALNIARAAEQRHAQREHFSDKSFADIDVLSDAVNEILSMTLCAMETDNSVPAQQVEPLEQVIDKLTFDAKMRHIESVQRGESSVNLGLTLAELIYDIERISDHCSNIAVCVVRLTNGTLSDHAYMKQLKSDTFGSFADEYKKYSEKYSFTDK